MKEIIRRDWIKLCLRTLLLFILLLFLNQPNSESFGQDKDDEGFTRKADNYKAKRKAIELKTKIPKTSKPINLVLFFIYGLL